MHSNPRTSAVEDQRRTRDQSRRGAAVIAAGDYVRTQVIPALRRAGFALRVVADLEPHVAAYVQSRFGFEAAETDWRAALEHPGTDVAVIATYHDSHAEIAAAALNQGKKVILEKPPAVTRADLDLLLLAAAEPGAFLEVGFNRRYAPFARAAKQFWIEGAGPTTISIVVKEVEIPPTHWYRWPKEGTRVTGNLCHWIDFIVFTIGAEPTPLEVTLSAPAAPEPDEERTLTVVFDDGSVASIVATQRGDATLGVQETIDIRRGPTSIRIDDFRNFRATDRGRVLDRRRSLRNKGHRAMYAEMLGRIMRGEPPLYTLPELRRTTELTLTATEMVLRGDRHVALG
jgi:predicted dehydrogenase